MKKSATIGAAAVLGLSLALTGCGGSGTPAETGSDGEALVIDGVQIADAELYQAAVAEGTMTLYDNYPEGPWRALLDQFTEDTGIEVEHVRLVTPQLYERVVSESGAGRVAADAIGFGDITLMQDLTERGILAAYESPIAVEGLEEGQYDSEFHWYTSANLVMVPTYNERVLDEADLPESWEDLLDPQWQGRIGFTPIETGGSAFSVYAFLRDIGGIEYWEDLAANQPRLYESVTPLTQDIVRGEIPLGVTSLGTVATQRRDGAPITSIFFDEGTPAFANLVAVTEGAQSPNAARVYLDWLLSQRGQSVLVDLTSEYPVRTDVDAPTVEGMEIPAPDTGAIVVPSFDLWTESRDTYTEDWNAIFR